MEELCMNVIVAHTPDLKKIAQSNSKTDRGLKERTELPKRVRQIFDVFGVADPEDINSAKAQE